MITPLFFFYLFDLLRKENVLYKNRIALVLENTWFLEINCFPFLCQSKLNDVYDKEVIRIISSPKKNTLYLLQNSLSKFFKGNDLNNLMENFNKDSLFFEIKDSFEAKIFNFLLIIDKLKDQKIEFQIKIAMDTFKEINDSLLKLEKYLERNFLREIFRDLFD